MTSAPRGRPAVIRDPAVAIAAAKCWVTRFLGGTTLAGLQLSAFHPESCGFCDFPLDYLIKALEEFNVWAGLEVNHNFVMDPANPVVTPVRAPVEAFLTLPASEQDRLVKKAQGYLGDGEEEEED